VAREQRKLAAILAADVVGYSRLMGRDERWRTYARTASNAWITFYPSTEVVQSIWPATGCKFQVSRCR
jgi:hypothetical protein